MPIAGVDRAPFKLVQCKLGYFSDYLEAIEEFLEGEIKELDNRFATAIRQIERDEDVSRELDEWHLTPDELAGLRFGDNYKRLQDVFPSILRQSLFVALYSFFESQLIIICRDEQVKRGGSVEPFDDWKEGKRESAIVLAHDHLKREIGIEEDFPDTTTEWQMLKDHYTKLRNCIVHSEGRLLPGWRKWQRDDPTRLIRYVLNNTKLEWLAESLLQEVHAWDNPGSKWSPTNRHLVEAAIEKATKEIHIKSFLEKYDRVVVHKGFCEDVLRTIESFFEQLFAVL